MGRQGTVSNEAHILFGFEGWPLRQVSQWFSQTSKEAQRCKRE